MATEETTMPLVRIALRRGKPPLYRRRLGEIVYETMIETLNVPPADNFQITTEHDPLGLVYDPEYLGIHRTDEIVMLQITLNEGRTVDAKKQFYRRLTERLNQELALRPEDLFVSLVEVKKENWSFGNGEAQYAA
jgi:phenylpyruvate tautomerase PptA (4-oxalocrotonate tautomerase family)